MTVVNMSGHKGICASILNDSKRQMELYNNDSKTTTQTMAYHLPPLVW